MNIFKIWMLFAFILVMNEKASSQNIADLSYYYLPIKEGEINALEANIKLPIDVQGNYKYIGGIGYQQINIANTPLIFTNNLYSLKVPLSLIKVFNNKEQLIAIATGALNSDFKTISINDVIVSGMVAYRKQVNKYTSISYGLGYSRQFFGNQLAPIIGFDYKKKKWQLKGKFPITANAILDIGKNNKIGIGWRILGSSYKLNETQWNNVYMKERSLFLALTYYRKLYKNINLEIATGFASQNLEFYDQKFSGFTLVTAPLGESPEALQKWSNKGYFFSLSFVITNSN